MRRRSARRSLAFVLAAAGPSAFAPLARAADPLPEGD